MEPKWKSHFLCMLHGCEITTYSLSLSLSLSFVFCCVVTFLHSGFGTVHHSVCTPSTLHPPTLLPISPRSSFPLSVVYQDGFYGAADLYVSKLTSRPTHPLCPSPSRLSPALLFPLGVILHVASSHALHRAACIKVNEPTARNRLETQRTACFK